MSKNMLTIVKKEFARFFGDKRMVFTSVLLPGLMIYVMYSVMGNAFADKFNASDEYEYVVHAVNMPECFASIGNEENITIENVSDAEIEGIKTEITNQETDFLVVFPENFEADVMAYDAMSETEAAPQVEMYYNSVSTESYALYNMMLSMCDEYESALANRFDINAGEDVSYDLATKEDTTAEFFAMMLPMLMLMFLFSGCMAIAPESIAGEKERGTIATLLVTPMKRSELALGKVLSLSIIGLLSGFSSFVGTMLALPKMLGGIDPESMNASVYGMAEYAMLLGVILSTVLVIVGAISVISGLSKSVKEAGTAITPLMIIAMVISLTSMFGDGAVTERYLYCIPLYNSVQCMTGIFSFSMDPMNLVITMASNIVVTVIMVAVLTKIFDSERIMYN